jgi:hypothetical protein
MEDIITKEEPFDVKPSKGKYIWSNRFLVLGHIEERINLFLVHRNLLLHHYIISSKIIPSSASNHNPIAFHMQDAPEFIPLPFCSNSLWLQDPMVLSKISKDWQVKVVGSLNFLWEYKLKEIKLTLKD